MQKIVIVGASLAGVRAAQRLRFEGYTSQIVMVGEETGLPYDRPPLSKQFLQGDWGRDDIGIVSSDEFDELQVDYRPGTRAVGVRPESRALSVENEQTIGYDGLIIATGARPRLLPGLDPGSEGIHVLRTLDDSLRLAQEIRRTGSSLGIIGGGFLGSEAASAARSMGAEVTMLERGSEPMSAVLGDEVGRGLAAIQRANGVDVRTEAAVREVFPIVAGGRPAVQVTLEDNSELVFDNVLVSVGAVPNVDWLAGSGLPLDNGLICDEKLFVEDSIVAAGDVARIKHPVTGFQRRIEHWTNAVQQGEMAAVNLLVGREAAQPFRAVPYVWSDQFGSRVEIIGSPMGTDEVTNIRSSPDGRQLLFCYRRKGALTALVGVNAVQWLLGARRQLTDLDQLSEQMVEDLKRTAAGHQAVPSIS
jgi:NADPH-dependent 2,4-dienoyl-CoA reductase/sulfur reductase-like enzyme